MDGGLLALMCFLLWWFGSLGKIFWREKCCLSAPNHIITMAATRPRRRHGEQISLPYRLLITTLISLALLQKCTAFSPSFSSRDTRASIQSKLPPQNKIHANNLSSTRLYNQGNQFDITKPTFDLLSFRPIRSDALLRYNSLNQSEPLRINLYLLATVSLLGYPLWSESVTGEVPTLMNELGVMGAGVVSAGLFWRERSRRSNQLKRMEKELNAGELRVRLPVNKGISSVRPEVALKELKSKRRIVAVRGSIEQLQSSGVLSMLCVLRRRLVQSQTLVVLIPTDGTISRTDWGLNDYQIGDALWLGDPFNLEEWNDYFSELVENPSDELAWFALNFNGRSIASGLSEPPKLLELLGQQLQPTEILDETDEPELVEGSKTTIAVQILEKQRQFYNVLTDSDDELKMKSVYSDKSTEEVNEVRSSFIALMFS